MTLEKKHVGYWKGKKRKPFSKEWKKNMSIGQTGRIQAEATKQKLSNMRKGNKNPFYGKHHTKEARKKISEAQMGDKHHQWKGGRYKSNGYIYILQPNHPFSNPQGYLLEHRVVMEKHLGRYLKPEEIVHHINEIIDDNRNENLQLFSNSSKHTKYHYHVLGSYPSLPRKKIQKNL